jgi:putative lipoic acid-binding regulatory protein
MAKEAARLGLTQEAISAAAQVKAAEESKTLGELKRGLLQAQINKTGAQQTQAEALAEKARKEQKTTTIGKVDPDKFTTESIQQFSETGNFRDLVVRPEKKDQFSEPYPITGADGKQILVQLNLQTRKVVPIDTASRVNVSASANVPKALKSIGDVRQQFNTNVKPYVTAANEAEQAEDMIDQASKGNFQGWRAAITQLAKSVGDSQISRAEIEAYGIDPSLIGSIVDRTSIFFSGTPSQDTINGAKKIATLVKKVNQDRAMKEQGTFLELAKEAEGYNPSKTPRFFELPFAPTTEGVREGTTSSGTKYKLTIK